MKFSRRALRKIRRTRRFSGVASVNLVSMIDMFIIMIIYLLVNTAAVQVMGADLVDLPSSLAQEPPRETVAVIISAEDILVDGEPLMKVAEAKAAKGEILEALKARLLMESPPPASLQTADGAVAEGGEVNILADKSIPYSLLKKVMKSCTAAQFNKISMGVVPSGKNK